MATLTIASTSPSIVYLPFADPFSTPNLLLGWNPFYTNTGYATTIGLLGNGTPYHASGVNGATLSLRWNGTGIELFGNATNAAYDITLDGRLANPNSTSLLDSSLAAFRNLSNTEHTITLTVRIPGTPTSNSFIAFEKAILDFPEPGPDTAIVPQIVKDADISFSGTWNKRTNETIPGSYYFSSAAGDFATVFFRGAGITLAGLLSPQSGQYRVVLDGEASALSARSSFVDSSALLFFATDLDATVTHQLTIVNDDGSIFAVRAGGLSVMGVQNINPPPPTTAPSQPSQSTSVSSNVCPKGTIAAIVLAGFVSSVLLVAVLIVFLWWRPRERRRKMERREMLRQRRILGSFRDPDKGGDSRMTGNILDIIAPTGERHEDVLTSDGLISEGYGLLVPNLDLDDVKHEDLEALPSTAESKLTGKKSKGKARARDKNWSNVTLDLPNFTSLPGSSSRPRRKRGTSSSSSSAPRSNTGSYNKGFGGMPSNYEQPSPRDLANQPPVSLDLPSERQPDANLADPLQEENTLPIGDTAALALSPRTADLAQSFWNPRSIQRSFGLGSDQERQTSRSPGSGTSQTGFFASLTRKNREETKTSKDTDANRRRWRRRSRSRRHRDDQSLEHTAEQGKETSDTQPAQPAEGPSQLQRNRATERDSFLDFGSSNPSTRSRKSGLSHSQDDSSEQKKSRWSDNALPRQEKDGSGSSPRSRSPSRLNISATPNLRQIPPSPQSEHPSNPLPPLHPYASLQVSPSFHLAPLELQPASTSPTDSVPMTVSDIHFRHSLSDRTSNLPSARDSRRISTGSHLPPHPPLSGVARGRSSAMHTQPFAPPMQERPGRASPPLIVQRVLGMSPPATASRLVDPPTTGGLSGGPSGGGSIPVAESPRSHARSPSIPAFLPSSLRFSPALGRSKTPSKSGSEQDS